MKLIADPRNEGYTGTLLYALQGLNCEGYFLDFIKVLSHGSFESSEMALELIERYADGINYATKLQALNSLKEQERKLNSELGTEAGKFDRIHYIHHALKLLED